MSSFDEVKKSLQDIQRALNQTDKSYSFQDIDKQIASNIASLKQILIPLDNNANNIKNALDISHLPLPPLKTYKPIPKMKLNVGSFINNFQAKYAAHSANKSRPSTVHENIQLSPPPTSTEIRSISKINQNENGDQESIVYVDYKQTKIHGSEYGKATIFKKERENEYSQNEDMEDIETSVDSNATFIVHDYSSDISSCNITDTQLLHKTAIV